MHTENAGRFDVEGIKGRQAHAAQQADRQHVIQRALRIHHDDKLAARTQNPRDFGLGAMYFGDVMQNAVTEDNVEGRRRIGDRESAALLDVLKRKAAEPQPGPHPRHRLGGEVETGPAGAAANDLLRLRALSKPDLQYGFAGEIDLVEALWNVRFGAIAVRVIGAKERFVVSSIPVVQTADLLIAARMRLPEPADRRFVHSALGQPAGFEA